MSYSFRPQYSFVQIIYSVILAVFAMICVLTSQLLPTIIAVLIGGIFYFLSRSKTIIAFRFDGKQAWILETEMHQFQEASLLGSSVLWRYLIILHFQLMKTGERRTVCVFSDSITMDEFRLLRRCVRMCFL